MSVLTYQTDQADPSSGPDVFSREWKPSASENAEFPIKKTNLMLVPSYVNASPQYFASCHYLYGPLRRHNYGACA